MTEYKKGDRLRITIEGVVEISMGKYVSLDDETGRYLGNAFTGRAGVTVEKLADSLPTTWGSVIRYPDGAGGWIYRILDDDGMWHAHFNTRRGTTPDEVEAFHKDEYEIVYDAGKAS